MKLSIAKDMRWRVSRMASDNGWPETREHQCDVSCPVPAMMLSRYIAIATLLSSSGLQHFSNSR